MLTVWLLLAVGVDPAFTAVVATNQKDWLSDDNFSDRALGMGHKGIVEADIFVDASGAPKACYVVMSSGSRDLDGQTCAGPMHKGRFIPARDVAGQPTDGIYRYRTVWTTEEAFTPTRSVKVPADVTLAVARLPQQKTYLEVQLRYVVDETGRIVRCAVERTSGFAGLDGAACAAMPQRYTFAPARDADGTARSVVRTQSVAFEVSSPTSAVAPPCLVTPLAARRN